MEGNRVAVIPKPEIIKSHRFIFVTDDLRSGTSIQKAIMPSRSISFHGGISSFFDYSSFLKEYIYQKKWSRDDVIILTKFVPGARVDHFYEMIEELYKIKSEIGFIFCEASEELSFAAIESYSEEKDKFSIKKIINLIDGYLYETKPLHDLFQDKFDSVPGLFTRHPHSNCSSFFNPYSPINIDNQLQEFNNKKEKDPEELFGIVSQQAYKNIANVSSLGYIGRAKYCHNFTMLMRACYNASHKVGRPLNFYYSNSGVRNNLIMHYENLDLGLINLYRNRSKKAKIWFDYKASSKILCMWSLGIPVLCSPLPSYVKVMQDCNIDVDKWTFDFESLRYYDQKHTFQNFHMKSIEDGKLLSEKIFETISDKNFEEEREKLFIASRYYNPVNIGWLYSGLFNFLNENRGL